jgi:hypothetical protein
MQQVRRNSAPSRRLLVAASATAKKAMMPTTR